MNTKQLRKTILDLAIRGELVPQDPTDEPASALLERIRAEKEQLIKDKKLKRDKKESEPIDEVPFELPEGWEWCRLGEIAYIAAGSTPESSSFVDKGIPYLKVYNLRNQAIDFDYKPQYIKESIHNGILKRSKTEIGDLIMNIVGPPLGKLAIIPTSLPESNFNQAAVLIRPYLYKNIINKYLFYFLSEMSEINSISTKGSAGQINISLSQSKNMRVPLPPLAEQHRIVEKIEQLFALVDTIETHKEQLKSDVKQAKIQVLNYAIAGKLTHQDPNDEPAEALLKRIGKTTAADTPYEKLPKGWAWCRLGEVCNIYQPKTITTKEISDTGKYKVFGANGIIGYYDKYNHDSEEIAVTCRGATCGTVNITEPKSWITGNAMVVTPLNSYLSKKYLFYYLENTNMKNIITGSAQPQITKTNIETLFITLPPLQEQHRIVEKIENYFSFLDTIESNL